MQSQIDYLKDRQPELPRQKTQRLKSLGCSWLDSRTLVEEPGAIPYFDDCLNRLLVYEHSHQDGKQVMRAVASPLINKVVYWMLGDLLSIIKLQRVSFDSR